jgi:hypothetical protein
LAGLKASAATRRDLTERQRAVQAAVAAAAIGPLAEQELFLVGLGLYWAEGSKSKPYATRERVVFVNSDPTMITTFLAWLALLGVPRAQCRFRVAIHESADIAAAERSWAAVVGIERDELCKTTVKRHRPTTNRLNTGHAYAGCLVINVSQSADLYRFISGWWTGLSRQASAHERRAAEWPAEAPWRTWRRFGR